MPRKKPSLFVTAFAWLIAAKGKIVHRHAHGGFYAAAILLAVILFAGYGYVGAKAARDQLIGKPVIHLQQLFVGHVCALRAG